MLQELLELLGTLRLGTTKTISSEAAIYEIAERPETIEHSIELVEYTSSDVEVGSTVQVKI